MEGDLEKRIRRLEATDYGPGGRAEQIWAEVIGTEDEAKVKKTLIQKCKFQAPDEKERFQRTLEGTDGDSDDGPEEPEDLDLPAWKIDEMAAQPAGYVEEPETVEREPIDPSFYSESELRQIVQYDDLNDLYMADFVREARDRGEVPKVFSDFQAAALRRAKELDIQPEIRSLLVQARKKLIANAKAKAKELKKAAKIADATAQSQIAAAAAAATVGGGQGGVTRITMPKGPDGQPLYKQLRCDGYIVGDRGILAYDDKPVQVSYIPIIPVSEMYSKSENGRSCVELAWPAHMPSEDGKVTKGWRTLMLDRTVIASDVELAKALSAARYPVDAKTKRELSHYITSVLAQNDGKLPIKWSAPKLGWLGGEIGTMLPYDGNVTLDLSQDQKDAQVDKVAKALVSVKGDPKEWLDRMVEIRKSGRRDVLIALATVAGAPLIEPLTLNGFLVDIVAKSGMGKTVFAMVAASFVGDPRINRYPKKWLDSKRSLEITGGFLRNFCLIIDDTRSRHDSLKEPGAMEAIVYSIAGTGTSSLGTATGGVRPGEEYSITGLSTAEESYEVAKYCNAGGSKGRLISVPLEAPIVEGDTKAALKQNLHDLADWLKRNHGHGIRPWIEAIKEIGVDELQRKYGEWNAKVTEKYGEKASKQGDALALLMLVDELLEERIFHDGVTLNLDELGDLLTDDTELDENTRAYNLILEKISSEPFRFIEAESQTELMGLASSLRQDFAKLCQQVRMDKSLRDSMSETINKISNLPLANIKIPNQQQYGFPDPEPPKDGIQYMYFYPQGLRKILEDAEFGMNGFVRWAQKNGLLKNAGDTPYFVTTHLGHSTRVYALDVSIANITEYLADPAKYRAQQRFNAWVKPAPPSTEAEINEVFGQKGQQPRQGSGGQMELDIESGTVKTA